MDKSKRSSDAVPGQRAMKFAHDIGQLAANSWNAIDWRRRAVRDGVAIVGAVAVIYALAHWYDLPPKLFQFGEEHADWEVDDIIFVMFVMSIGFAVYSYRRVQDLRYEMQARRSAEIDSQTLARHDPLTGLPNRRFFVERLRDVLLHTTGDSRSALLMLDLDGFKAINDAYGHAIGDQTLIEFAERVSGVMRAGAVLTRVGGDEFAVIAPNISSLDDPTALARRIAAVVAEPFVIDSISTTLGAGIGIAIAPQDGTDPEILVQHADRALYRAKAEGRSSIRFFEPGMNAHVERRIAIERELRVAVSNRLIVPHYQPLIALGDDRIIGFEALARWKNEELGSVAPGVFIAVAEEIGLIGELGDQLLRQACTDARSWPPHITLSFNLSGIQLRDPTVGLRILSILAETGFNPLRLELEITETALVDNIGIAQQVTKQLRNAGVRIALDDFGTGYATFSQLLSLELDRIKIDRSFVDGLGKDRSSTTIVRAILGLANGFGLATTAEGIERPDQLAHLLADGCQEGQGYLFSKALPADEVMGLLANAMARAVS
jgi:diguanylate cyclase (GGDEF)-like protein